VGKLKSKPIETCLTEFQDILESGCKKIMLVAENVGAYGLDINTTFPELLTQLLGIEGDYKIEIEELHPIWLIKYWDKLVPLLGLGKIKLIVCPIQSGSDRILKLMNRQHDKLKMKNTLIKMKNIYPGLQLNTIIIIGFPSETEKDFQETLDIVKEIGFGLVVILGYSKNPYLIDPELIKREIPQKVIRAREKKAVEFFKKNKIICSTA